MKITIALIITLFALLSSALAQTETDYQLRFPLHLQFPIAHDQGVAVWAVLPDVTQTSPFKGLLVGGWLAKDPNSWKELMAGGLFGTDGSVIPVLDLRFYSNSSLLELYTELMLRPDRSLANVFATHPFKFKPLELRLGFESEMIVVLDNHSKNIVGIGPRASVKFAKLPWLTIATSDMVGLKSKTVVRTYVIMFLKKT